MDYKDVVAKIKDYYKEIYLLSHVQAILGWDQETYMPEAAIAERAEQAALLQSLIHKRRTSDELGRLLEEAGASSDRPAGAESLSDTDAAIVRETYREYSRAIKLPEELVVRFAQVTSRAQAVWQKARIEDDFGLFAPVLSEIVDMVREMASLYGYQEHPYDALLDEYEPYAKASDIKRIFDAVEAPIVELVQRIGEINQVDDSFLHYKTDKEEQKRLSLALLDKLGYDFKRGRLDVSAHPFTTTLGSDDVRITTRFLEDFLPSSIFGTIHEAGHALYEMGISADLHGTILADGVSLGIHESQSRFWENVIGRRRSFWQKNMQLISSAIPALSDVSAESFYKAVNKVKPSFIRVEADEVTYILHIILRFRLEMGMVDGSLEVNDLPDAWNQQTKALLGIVPKKYSDGVLQDIHWSFGGIGYFPTYALGTLYASQFAHAIEKELGSIDELIAKDRLADILSWLRDKIHKYGKIYPADELCRRATGESLNPEYFIKYIEGKYGDVYNLS
ncbi:carboxypeptidase M32 [Spirochaetia bacterium 38H-sp]|uniref:Metal-dependent carboxypeptidase n=1 Tax=Rarispira pelagica TaxID=3141764 RepID=A0ABU9UD65_9SPIR